MPVLQLLIVEDNPDDADLLLRELRRAGFDPQWSRVETEPDFLAALENAPEIVLCDYSMPHFSGLRALELLRASGRDIPFILISGTVGEDAAVQAMRDGATDYLLKDRPARLAGAVKRALAEAQLHAERHQAEAAQAQLAAIVTFSADAIIGKDLNGIVTSWNGGAERIFGYTATEMVGTSILRLIPADRHDEEEHILGRIRQSESVEHFDTLRQTKDGRLIDVSVTASPIQDAMGRVTGVSKVARDISERKRTEKELRFQQAMLTTERELTLDGILVVDDHSRVLSFNGRFAQMWGISADILSTRADTVLLQAVWNQLLDPERFMDHVRQLYDRHDQVSRDEVELTDGRLFDRYSAPMRDSDGRYYGRVWYFRDVTERRDAEAALRQERDRAQRFLDTSEVMLVALDLQARITLANRYACSVLGWTANELLGRDWFETCTPARLRDVRRQKFQDVIGADLTIVENLIVTRVGEERLIEWRHTVLRDDTGNVVGTLSSGSDITERKLAESAVRRERDRAQRYLDTAEVILLALDTEGRITSINRKGCDLLGWTEPELLGLNWVEACLPDRLRQPLKQKFENLVDGDVSVVENPILTKARQERLIEWRNTVLRDDAGHVIGTFSSGADITERHEAVEALRTAEARMRFALEAADVGIWDMDYTSGVLRWSEILEAHYGLQPGTFVGTFEAFVERVHPDDRESVLATVGKAMKSGTDFSILNRALHPDGTVRWLSGAGRVFLDEHGKPLRGVGISLDVTERRMLEEQYQQAQKMEAVGRLAGGVAHDFNNLLTVILGYCELLLSDLKTGDPHQADIAEIQKAGTRAGGLTHQLLAFSRKQIIEPTLLDLNLIATDMRAMLGRLIGEDVKVVLALRPELAPVKADRGQVEQVVMNLAVNARDAMPKGGTLTIETANVELDEHYAKTHQTVKPGAYVALTVTDTGTGMTPEVQSRLFEPFFTTKEVGKGTGLGMATVYGIVTRSGGSVGVYSEIGKGTSFKVYFPRADAADMVIQAPTTPVAPARVGTQTVLVVEDEDGLRELAKRLLLRQGYTVLVAANAEEALRLFEANQSIDVLLTDVVMPGASGPELTRQLVEQRPALRVVYMSGYTEDAIVQHGVLKPGIAFLNKPFNSETLGAKIREVLER